MINNIKTGFYGKLPSNGDFLSRNLSHEITLSIDEWFQISMTQLRHRLPDWSYFFNSSPSWFFLVPCNFFSTKAYAGYIAPSIDRVGRCFPLIILKEIHKDVVLNIDSLQQWYLSTETIVQNCLRSNVSADELMISLDKIEMQSKPTVKELQDHESTSQNDILDVLFANIPQPAIQIDSYPLKNSSLSALNFELSPVIRSFEILSSKSHWWYTDKLTSKQNRITHEGLHNAALFTRLFVNA
jgi:type VI secretion system ImpM family protein